MGGLMANYVSHMMELLQSILGGLMANYVSHMMELLNL